MKLYWILILLGIVCALFADKIDIAAKANNKLKKALYVVCGVLLLISIILIITSLT